MKRSWCRCTNTAENEYLKIFRFIILAKAHLLSHCLAACPAGHRGDNSTWRAPLPRVRTTSAFSRWVWRSGNSMPGSSWITEFLTRTQTRASLQRNLISATSSRALCLRQPLPTVHDHRWGTEWISTCEVNNSPPLFYQTQSISLFKMSRWRASTSAVRLLIWLAVCAEGKGVKGVVCGCDILWLPQTESKLQNSTVCSFLLN